jgi:tetraacyldisaccharide 4'-kinase
VKIARLKASAALWLHRQWQKRGLWAWLLWPLSWLVRGYVFAKHLYYKCGAALTYRAPVPVIIVGNIYVGGVGKTPVVIAIVQELVALGWNPGVVSRGYGVKLGAKARTGRGELDARLVGDEPALISAQTNAPVGVHPNRRRACDALLLAYPEVDIIVSDDGLQHLALERDFEIVVQDERRIGNGWLLPAGPLRESSGRLQSADLVITRHAEAPPQGHAQLSELTVWLSITEIHSLDNKIKLSVKNFIDLYKKSQLTAVAAISEPDRFFKLLHLTGIPYQQCIGLPDHHNLSSTLLSSLQADIILITSKDAVKCQGLNDPRVWVVATEAVFSDPLWVTPIANYLKHRPA